MASKTIPPKILAILAAATTVGNKLTLPGQLERPDYVAVDKVLRANGGAWNKKERAHVFEEDAAEAIEQALLTGEFRRVKQELGQFDTPPTVAKRIFELAGIRAGMKVLEPQAGVGNLIGPAWASGAFVYAYEIDPKRFAKLIENYFPDGTAEEKGAWNVDFLKVEPRPIYDRIIMNPPFARQADIDHVMHALQFLKPGGRLVAIMSNGWTFRQDKKSRQFASMVEDHAEHFEHLPAGSFASAGTMVNTCIVAIDA